MRWEESQRTGGDLAWGGTWTDPLAGGSPEAVRYCDEAGHRLRLQKLVCGREIRQ